MNSSAAVFGCIDIVIVDDDLKEREESFVVEVTNGSLVLAQITVNIESSDGRQTRVIYSNFIWFPHDLLGENVCTEGSVTAVRDADNSGLQLVEMCDSEGVWSPLCDNEWTLLDARVVCRETAQGLSKSVVDKKIFLMMKIFSQILTPTKL